MLWTDSAECVHHLLSLWEAWVQQEVLWLKFRCCNLSFTSCQIHSWYFLSGDLSLLFRASSHSTEQMRVKVWVHHPVYQGHTCAPTYTAGHRDALIVGDLLICSSFLYLPTKAAFCPLIYRPSVISWGQRWFGGGSGVFPSGSWPLRHNFWRIHPLIPHVQGNRI